MQLVAIAGTRVVGHAEASPIYEPALERAVSRGMGYAGLMVGLATRYPDVVDSGHRHLVRPVPVHGNVLSRPGAGAVSFLVVDDATGGAERVGALEISLADVQRYMRAWGVSEAEFWQRLARLAMNAAIGVELAGEEYPS